MAITPAVATSAQKQEPEKQFTLFKATMQSCQYFFKDGSRADFVAGRFATDDPVRIAELQAEIKAKHPHIRVDAKELTTTQVVQDPLSHLRAKIRAELEAEMMANPQQHGVTSVSAGEGAGIATSSIVAGNVAKSDSPSK
jgi:hypothetical protein